MTKNGFTVTISFLSRQSKFFEIQFLSSGEIADAVLLKYFISVEPQNSRLLIAMQRFFLSDRLSDLVKY